MAISNFVKFITTAGFSSTFEIPDNDEVESSALNKEVDRIFKYHIEPTSYPFDLYCPYCEDDSVFYFYNYYVFDELDKNALNGIISVVTADGVEHSLDNDRLKVLEKKDFSYSKDLSNFGDVRGVIAKCSRSENHQIIIFVEKSGNKITKIGQSPDAKYFLNTKNVTKYKKYLGFYVEELRTALQLHNYNVGVGSYVYLRRVLEKLVFDKYDEHKADLAISEEEFKNPRFSFEEKVRILKEYLPKFMLDNVTVYAILSKGIHELDEEECNTYFEFLYESITSILDEIILKKDKENEHKRLTGIVSKIKSTLSSNSE